MNDNEIKAALAEVWAGWLMDSSDEHCQSVAMRHLVDAVEAAERERWRGIAHRVAADANRYGLEGLRMRCTISESGGLVSWSADKAGFAKPGTSAPLT